MRNKAQRATRRPFIAIGRWHDGAPKDRYILPTRRTEIRQFREISHILQKNIIRRTMYRELYENYPVEKKIILATFHECFSNTAR